MRRELAERAQALPRSGIRRIMELAAGRSGVVHLEVGEPDFATPPHIVEAAYEAARSGFTRYTPNAGLPALREAVAERYTERWGRPVDPGQVVVSSGAVGGLAAAFFAVLDPGDEILVPDPGWPNYVSAVELAGAVARPYPLPVQNGFVPDPEGIRRLIGKRTRAILVNSPSNPTGRVVPGEVLAELMEVARESDLFVISDEVYEEFAFDEAHVSAGSLDEDGRVIVVTGVSKTYSMTGWRIGFVIAPSEVAEVVAKIQEPLFSCASSVSQKAAEAALRGPQECVGEMLEVYRRRRDLVVEVLGRPGLLAAHPTGSFYALVRVGGEDDDETARLLLEEQKVATAPGSTFGRLSRGHVRVSFATETSALGEGLRRIARMAASTAPAPNRE